MAKRALRFGITNGANLRASTWKLWTETAQGKSDVYLTCRALGGALKSSLHDSGQWHIAYSKETFESSVKGALPGHRNRFKETWPRPAEIAPGVTLAYRIVTPASAVTSAIKPSNKSPLIWIPNAPEGDATEINIFSIAPHTTVIDWPCKRSMGTSLIGSFPLENGETVWAVYRRIPMPKFQTAPGSAIHCLQGQE